MRERIEIRLCGFGGQGIVLMGVVLGEAAVRDGLWAAGSNSYGAQARGSACQSEVVLSRAPVDYPRVLAPDLLVALSQEAYERYAAGLREDGVAVYDAGLVIPGGGPSQPHIPVDATRTAVEGLSHKQVANMVMLAAVVALTGVVSREALMRAALDAVPARLRQINQRALEAGFGLGEAAREGLTHPLPGWALSKP